MSMTDGPADQNTRPGAAANLAAMRDRAGKVTSAFDRRQRTIMAVVFAATIGGVLAFSFLGSRTDWAPLMTNLTADDASAVTKQLETLGTEYQLADGGSTVEVPSDVVYQTRIDIAAVDMPSSGKVGYGILDNQDLTSSEFSQRIGFQRAMEGELAMTIEAIDGVTTASVHLALPKNDTFALDEQKATASVMVKTAKGKVLANRQVQAIVNLVAGGIEGLSPSDVTVADAEGNVLAAPGAPLGGGSSDTNEMQTSYENSLATSIEEMLGAIVGPGHAKATVTADLDFDASSSVSETYSAPTTIVNGEALAVNETTKTETYSGDGAAADDSGVLGPDGLPLESTTTGAGSGYELNERQVNNAVNKVVETTNKAPGAVQRLSVAVIVDEDAVGAEQIPDLETIVRAASGYDEARGDSVAVTRFKMDDTEATQLQEELAFREKTATATTPGGLPLWAMIAGGVLVLAVIVLFFRGRKRRKRDREDDELLELAPSRRDRTEQIITIDPAPRSASTRSNVADLTTNDSGPDLTTSGTSANGSTASSSNGSGVERREVLGDLIDNQPDEVAQLLRSWLGDRREAAR